MLPRLEPDDEKLSSPVLRGGRNSDVPTLPDKTAGLRDRNTTGLISLAIWVFDLVTTFAARNPFSYTVPMTIILCILFNIGTMLAGEIGFAIWRLTKD
ncbi:hypothetical protein [Scytonema sp. UIC 10036]|uniref:hypothetical protein n=1 Tax=Scytonema sp. UIC 10036 TaxID=2304196 RepID=UPI001A9B07CA|nr:hypothetical protein [Scytonema sp. UIC 10036]